MWINENQRLLQERVVMPDTGLVKVVSVKIKGSGKKAEQEAIRRLEDKVLHIADTRMLLSVAIDTYIKECAKTLKQSTVKKYQFELKSFHDIVGECYLDHITAGFIRTKLIDSGKPNRTLNGYIKEFKAFWMWAYRNDLVSREVADKLQRFQDTPEKERIQDKYLEPGELKALLDNMAEKRWYLLSRLLVLSGMRIGEAIALNRTDVWGTVIKVTKTYDHNNHIVTSPKSFDSKRDIFIQDELRECLDEIIAFVEAEKEITGMDSDLFFPYFDGSYIPYASYCKYLRELSGRVLNRTVSPHIFRHTHASVLFAKFGMSLEAVSSRLGHSDSKITKEIYLHRMEELKEKENKQLNSHRLIG